MRARNEAAGRRSEGRRSVAAVIRGSVPRGGISTSVERVLSVESTRRATLPNGDQTVFLDVAFVCAAMSGTARVNDDESVDVGWFPIADLPERHAACVKRYLDGVEQAWFARPNEPASDAGGRAEQ